MGAWRALPPHAGALGGGAGAGDAKASPTKLAEAARSPPTLLTSRPFGLGAVSPLPGLKEPQKPWPTRLGVTEQFGANPRENSFLEVAERANAPAAFVRASLSRPPSSLDAASLSGLPIGLVLRPLAPSPPGGVPVVDWGSEEGAILRCTRCKAYVNAFSIWDVGGRTWTCSLCGFAQAAPESYACSLDARGRRFDVEQRPELGRGSVEHVATREYAERRPQPPTFLFLLDLSRTAAALGLVDAAVAGIRACVEAGSMQGGDEARVGLVTYDSEVHFHALGPDATVRTMVVSDLEDMFLPLPSERAVVRLGDGKPALLRLLDSLVETGRASAGPPGGDGGPCLGAALRGAALALEGTGGKLMVFTAGGPSLCGLAPQTPAGADPQEEAWQLRWGFAALGAGGAGAAAARAPSRSAARAKAYKRSLKEFATAAAKAAISVDLFLASELCGPDLAALAPLALGSGGELRHYAGLAASPTAPAAVVATQRRKLSAELLRATSRDTAWQAELKVRVSCGWRIAKVHGSFADLGSEHLAVPTCHEDQAFTVVLEREESQGASPLLCVQAALLYTTARGQRRIRVHTWGAVATSCLNTAARSVDVEAALGVLAASTLERTRRRGLHAARNQLVAQCGQLVHTGQRAGTEAMKQVALHALGLLKSPAFRLSAEASAAELRPLERARLATLPLEHLAACCHARLVALHPCLGEALRGAGRPEGEQLAAELDRLRLSAGSLSPDGIYLLENGSSLLLWAGQDADPALLRAAFGEAARAGGLAAPPAAAAPAVAAAAWGGAAAPAAPAPVAEGWGAEDLLAERAAAGEPVAVRLAGLLAQARAERPAAFLPLRLLRPGDRGESAFFADLIEDPTQSMPCSFSQFVRELGQRVPWSQR